MTKKFLSDGFRAAFNGLRETVIFEKSFKVMLVIAIFVVAAMFYFPTSRLEKIVLLLTTFSVLILELINSTVERIMKDLMAAIVLLASFGAVVVGALIFLPYIFNF